MAEDEAAVTAEQSQAYRDAREGNGEGAGEAEDSLGGAEPAAPVDQEELLAAPLGQSLKSSRDLVARIVFLCPKFFFHALLGQYRSGTRRGGKDVGSRTTECARAS